jgi:hypothetical protein
MESASRHRIGTILFIVGIACGLALALSAIWGDFEAMSYFYTGAGNESFDGLRCPIIMSATSTASVSSTFDNPTEAEIQPYYEVTVSGITGPRAFEGQLAVPAHSSKSVGWQVDAGDIDLGYFVMVKVKVLPVADHSTREATCGILVLTIGGLSGPTLLGIALTLSLLGIVSGLTLRELEERTRSGKAVHQQNALRALGVITLLAMLAGLMGWWGIGLICCAVSILMMVISLRVAAW